MGSEIIANKKPDATAIDSWNPLGLVNHQILPRPVYVLDEDRVSRRSTVTWLRNHSFEPRPYLTSQDLLDELSGIASGCVFIGTLSSEASFEPLLRTLQGRLAEFPVVVSIRPGDVAGAVLAMKRGASDVIEHAIDRAGLIAVLDPIFERLRCRAIDADIVAEAQRALSALSYREGAILSGVVEGLSTKEIAAILELNVRTVEMSRGKMMRRLQVRTLSDVLRLAFRAGVAPLGERLLSDPAGEMHQG
jgi:two-component system response regulator FixJ